MPNNTHLNHQSAQTRPITMPTPTQPKSDPNWKPQPCGFSREELRKIVAEMMG